VAPRQIWEWLGPLLTAEATSQGLAEQWFWWLVWVYILHLAAASVAFEAVAASVQSVVVAAAVVFLAPVEALEVEVVAQAVALAVVAADQAAAVDTARRATAAFGGHRPSLVTIQVHFPCAQSSRQGEGMVGSNQVLAQCHSKRRQI
jgi:hypothetical protein